MNKGLLFGGIAAIAFIVFKKKKAAIENLGYRVKGVSFEKIKNLFDILGLRLKVILEVTNPGSVPVGFKSFVGQVHYNGSSIGQFKIYDPIQLLPGVPTQVKIPLSADSISVITQLFQAIKNGTGANNLVTVKGLLKVGALDLSINETVNLTADGI